MKKKSNDVADGIVKSLEDAIAHAKGEKEARVTRVVNLFTKTELNTLLRSLDTWQFHMHNYLADIGVHNERRAIVQKNIHKATKLEDKINKILESMK